MRSLQSIWQDQSGGIITGWFLKIAIVVAILVFLGLEVGAVVVTRLQAGDIAGSAATEAGIVWFNSRDVDAAEQRAERVAADSGASFIDLRVDEPAGKIWVTVEKTADTQVIQKIDRLRSLTVARATGSAPLRK